MNKEFSVFIGYTLSRVYFGNKFLKTGEAGEASHHSKEMGMGTDTRLDYPFS